MYLIIAATTNPAKIQAISEGFSDLFEHQSCHTEGVEVDSGVAAQPTTNLETRTGARQRVAQARRLRPNADFWVAIEAGVEDGSAFAWVVVENQTQRGESRSASFMLPGVIVQSIANGKELGEEMARLTGIENIKQKGGAIGAFTAGKLSRTRVYYQAVILALCPFHNAIYQQNSD
ncbi:inosine/xanthosine triphosphatase [Izhakiella capsodis]|uniref:Inosine/xanthosine triphosphatase n=1 Tax=Izhakiella capsodis TaxID=1367852 RepID=A0A1I4WYU8_9GAMM|nr:inosine/xanthosine triphosphatase [Izhakiella capsodis]SFN18901.1 inosine/xanthosine triphosphatase [Izhakiella capsodis]